MAAGDAIVQNNSTASGGTFTIQPGTGAEYVIHTIFVTKAANLIIYDGTLSPVIRAMPAGDLLTNIAIHLTNTVYMRIVDTSSSTNLMHVDGIATK